MYISHSSSLILTVSVVILIFNNNEQAMTSDAKNRIGIKSIPNSIYGLFLVFLGPELSVSPHNSLAHMP